VPGSTRALGFDTPSPHASQAGGGFGPRTVGHLGFTGTSLWIDPDRELIVVLLTNRVHPTRTNEAIRQFRPVLHERVAALWR
jgi:CubicO group peptidase (beta-lactamase class C family)